MRDAGGCQLTLSLEPGLLQRYSTLRECIAHSVMNRGLKVVAADVDLSVSELSRRLHPSPDDPRSLDVNVFVQIMEATGDLTPLHWLVARFIPDDQQRRSLALQKLERLLPEIASVLSDAKADRKRG